MYSSQIKKGDLPRSPFFVRFTESSQIHQHDLTVLDSRHPQHLLLGDRNTVSSLCTQAIDFNDTCGRHQVSTTTVVQAILSGFAGLQVCRHQARIGADPQALIVPGLTAGQGHETFALAFGKWLGAPGRCQAGFIGNDPDLKDLGRRRFQVVFAVGECRCRRSLPERHPLQCDPCCPGCPGG